MNETQYEPIIKNDPHFINISQMDSACALNRSANESMVEAIQENQALFRNNTALDPLNPYDARSDMMNESQMEAIRSNKPVYQNLSPIKISDREYAESYIEPIFDNQAAYKKEDTINIEEDQHESLEEPLPTVKAI